MKRYYKNSNYFIIKQLVALVFVVIISLNLSCKFSGDKADIGKRDDLIKNPDPVKLNVSTKQELGKISELLFGHNIEHTRSSVYQGLSAQMIRNRKFAGNPYPVTGQAMEWYTIGSENAFFLLDDSNGYTRHYDRESRNIEINCQRIQLYTNGKICGLGQDKLALEKNKKYEVRIVLKGSGKIPVNIRLLSGSSSKGYCEKNVRLDSTGTWQKFVFKFKSPSTDKNACIEITYTQKAELAIGSVSMLPSDNFYGMRSDVIELLKEIGTPILRWPGGSFANVYLWKDGLLDVDMRAPIWSGMNQANTGGYDYSEIGIDEFILLCRE